MNVKRSPNQSIAYALATILESILPNIKNTHEPKDLRGIKIDPESKGKAMQFTWNLETFKVTENLCVHERDFTNTWIKSEEAAKVEVLLRAKNEAA